MDCISISDLSIEQHFKNVGIDVYATLKNASSQEAWQDGIDPVLKERIFLWIERLDPTMLGHVQEAMDELVIILAVLTLSQAMYFLSQIQRYVPNIFTNLLDYSLELSGDDIEKRVYIDRIVTLHQLDLLKRLFSEDRTELVSTAINKALSAYEEK
jgi:hypothetical protein